MLPQRRHPVRGQLEEVPILVRVVAEIAFRNQRLHTALDVRTGEAVREKPPALGELLATELVPRAFELPLEQLENQPLDVFGNRHRSLRALSKKRTTASGKRPQRHQPQRSLWGW